MERYTKLEFSVGAFVLIGAAALGYLALTLGDVSLTRDAKYPVFARFSSVAGLKVGDSVKVAGVTVGEVKSIALADFNAQVELALNEDVRLPSDTIASIQSAGLLGDSFVNLAPGADDGDLTPGDRIARTEPAVSLTELIAKYAFGSPVEDTAQTNSSTAGEQQDGDSSKPSPFDDPLE